MTYYDNTIDEALNSCTPILQAPIHGQLLPLQIDSFRYVCSCEAMYIEARSACIEICLKVSQHDRKMAGGQYKEYIKLTNGRIPISLLDEMKSSALIVAPQEDALVLVFEDGQYVLKKPNIISASNAHISYENDFKNVVIDHHTHGYLQPNFSVTDDQDDTQSQIYIASVFGNLKHKVQAQSCQRVCVYGQLFYFDSFHDLFE